MPASRSEGNERKVVGASMKSPRRPPASIMVAGVIQVFLAAAALLDLRRRPSDQVRGSKKLWAAAAFVNFVGPLAYFVFGRRPS
jgi:hypothetical protein